MSGTISKVTAIPLTAKWADIFRDKVPETLQHPAAHFQQFTREGQFCTLVYIEGTDGQAGIGEAWGLPAPKPVAELINTYLGPALIGRPTEDRDGIWEALFQHGNSLGYSSGIWMEAMAGIDLALWDYSGKLHGEPVHQLLGGKRREEIPVYGSPVLFHETVGEAARQARDLVNSGHRAIKVKLGRDPDTDFEHLAEIRTAVGDDIDVLLDFNCALTLEGALAFAKQAASLKPYWLEEPFPPGRLEDYRSLRQETVIPIAAGENEFSTDGLRRLLDAEAIDVLTPNVTRAGGITGLRKTQAVATEYGVRLGLHGVGGVIAVAASLQLMSTWDQIELFESNVLPNPLRDELAIESIEMKNGKLRVPNRPGLGVELNEEQVRRFGPDIQP